MLGESFLVARGVNSSFRFVLEPGSAWMRCDCGVVTAEYFVGLVGVLGRYAALSGSWLVCPFPSGSFGSGLYVFDEFENIIVRRGKAPPR